MKKPSQAERYARDNEAVGEEALAEETRGRDKVARPDHKLVQEETDRAERRAARHHDATADRLRADPKAQAGGDAKHERGLRRHREHEAAVHEGADRGHSSAKTEVAVPGRRSYERRPNE